MVIWITIRPWLRFALSECLEHDNGLWIFGDEGASARWRSLYLSLSLSLSLSFSVSIASQ